MPDSSKAGGKTGSIKPETDDNPQTQKPVEKLMRTLAFIGFLVLHRARRAQRRLARAKKAAAAKLKTAIDALGRWLLVFCARNNIPIVKLTQRLKLLSEESGAAFKDGALASLSFVARTGLSALWRIVTFFTSVNYLAPIAAGVVFFTVVSATLNMTFALAVQVDGETLGYISDESIFESAEAEVISRIAFEDSSIRPGSDAVFSIAVVKPEQIIGADALTDRLIEASGRQLTSASGLYIDNKFLGAVTDKSRLDSMLESLLAPYRSGEHEESVSFVKKVAVKTGLFPPSSLVEAGALNRILTREESRQRIYTAVSGDSPILIAQKNNISYAQLKALNPDIEKRLMIGQEILIEKAVPVMEVKVTRLEMYEENVPFKIEQTQDASKYQGYVSITRVGKLGVNEKTARVTYIDGIEVEREVLSTSVITQPINERVVVGGKVPLLQIPGEAKTASSNFLWPADGGYVTCLFGAAGYYGHTGMDIGGLPQGSAIRASASGTVTKVAYNNYGYGYHIVINHGGGVETLYGHNSKIYVKAGDWVEQGQLIAGMGRTGRATGVHVHFEIRINGKYVNPSSYIGTRYA